MTDLMKAEGKGILPGVASDHLKEYHPSNLLKLFVDSEAYQRSVDVLTRLASTSEKLHPSDKSTLVNILPYFILNKNTL